MTVSGVNTAMYATAKENQQTFHLLYQVEFSFIAKQLVIY